MAVVQRDATLPLPRIGCLDRVAVNFDQFADTHGNGSCVYAPPPPPPLKNDIISVYSSVLAAAWLALWLLTGGVTLSRHQLRMTSKVQDVRLGTQPRFHASSATVRASLIGFLRAALSRLWHRSSYLWVLHPWDYIHRNRHFINAPQALLLCVAPVFAMWCVVAIALDLGRRDREAHLAVLMLIYSDAPHLLEDARNEAAESVAGQTLPWLQAWHVTVAAALIGAVLRELFRMLLLLANSRMHHLDLREVEGERAEGKLLALTLPREAVLARHAEPLEESLACASAVGIGELQDVRKKRSSGGSAHGPEDGDHNDDDDDGDGENLAVVYGFFYSPQEGDGFHRAPSKDPQRSLCAGRKSEQGSLLQLDGARGRRPD